MSLGMDLRFCWRRDTRSQQGNLLQYYIILSMMDLLHPSTIIMYHTYAKFTADPCEGCHERLRHLCVQGTWRCYSFQFTGAIPGRHSGETTLAPFKLA